MAVTAVVGKSIGAGKPDQAARRTRLGLGLGMAYMGLCALAMVIFREPAVRIFVAAVPLESQMGSPEAIDEIVKLGSSLLILAAAFQVFDALAIILVGALRGAGDTLWPGIVTVVLSWSLIVGLGWLFVERAPGLGSLGPWIGAAAYIIVLSVAILTRYASGAWRSIDLLDKSPAELAIPVDAGEGVIPELPAVDVPLGELRSGGSVEDQVAGP
jgi:MATE family multidrug resistance protein